MSGRDGSQSGAPGFTPAAVGRARTRSEGPLKVRGAATYAAEAGASHGVEEPMHGWLVTSRVAKGRVRSVNARAARELAGVLDVLDHTNAPRLAGKDAELRVLQDDAIAFRGQIVALVLATSAEAAREGARLVVVDEEDAGGHTAFEPVLDPAAFPDEPDDDSDGNDDEGADGDLRSQVEAALSGAAHRIDVTYSTPFEHNAPMEPHAIVARWNPEPIDGVRLEAWCATQGASAAAKTAATMFGLDVDQVRVRSPYVGGGFGSKGMPHAPDVAGMLLARHAPGRWVRLVVTRQQMFALTGYRARTVQRLRMGADEQGRIVATEHTNATQVSTVKSFVEGATGVTEMMYSSPRRRVAQEVATLDVPVTSWMRAPGEMPGAFALECAIDELADAAGLDPVEFRARNDVAVDPSNGKPFNDRRLVECLRLAAERFGRPLDPGRRGWREGNRLCGVGVAGATYPALMMPGNATGIDALEGGRYRVRMGAADIGQGAWTVLAQVAADALGVDVDAVDLEIGDSSLPAGSVAGGSAGTASWGASVIEAAHAFTEKFGADHEPGDSLVHEAGRPGADYKAHSMHSFGAHVVQVEVDVDTGEVRVPRMLGVFSVGRVLNPTLVHSQLIGGMTMGLGAALHEAGVRDGRTGWIATHDLASYHVPAHADVRDLDAIWLDEVDPRMGPLGARGVGEIGIVGAAAAVANAVHAATGVRVRHLPITSDALVGRMEGD